MFQTSDKKVHKSFAHFLFLFLFISLSISLSFSLSHTKKWILFPRRRKKEERKRRMERIEGHILRTWECINSQWREEKEVTTDFSTFLFLSFFLLNLIQGKIEEEEEGERGRKREGEKKRGEYAKEWQSCCSIFFQGLRNRVFLIPRFVHFFLSPSLYFFLSLPIRKDEGMEKQSRKVIHNSLILLFLLFLSLSQSRKRKKEKGRKKREREGERFALGMSWFMIRMIEK